MRDKIVETLENLALSIDKLADAIDADDYEVEKTASVSVRRDFGFGGVSDAPDKGVDPLLSFILS